MKAAYKVLNQADKTIILNPDKPLFSLIWLHGLGDSSAGFLSFFQHPKSPLYHGGRIKLLHAPFRPVTINGGMKCPSWYDIKILNFQGDLKDEDKRCSLKQVNQSLQILNKKVQQEVQFWKSQKVQGDIYQRIFVGGFSQGCAMSLIYGLTNKHLLGGVIGFSGYLFQSFQTPNRQKIPFLLYHGTYDQMIPFKQSKQSYKNLLNLKNVTFRQRDLQHEVSQQQISQMSQWILKNLKYKQ